MLVFFIETNFNTVIPRKERHAGISEDDHFHDNGLMVLYRHAGINRGMLFPEIFVLFLALSLSFKFVYYLLSFISKVYFQVEIHMNITSDTKTFILII